MLMQLRNKVKEDQKPVYKTGIEDIGLKQEHSQSSQKLMTLRNHSGEEIDDKSKQDIEVEDDDSWKVGGSNIIKSLE